MLNWGLPQASDSLSLSLEKSCALKLSGPISRDIARLSQRYPPIVRYGVFWCLNMANWVRYPFPLF